MPSPTPHPLHTWILVAGMAQLALVAAGACVPALLRWREHTQALPPLTRQVFWTYGGYVLGSHLAFSLLALLLPEALLDGSPLATVVTGFLLLWWLSRLVLQFACFDRRGAPPGPLTRGGEAVLVALFALLVVVFGRVFVANLGAPA